MNKKLFSDLDAAVAAVTERKAEYDKQAAFAAEARAAYDSAIADAQEAKRALQAELDTILPASDGRVRVG